MARSITAALRQIKDELDQHITPADIHAACRAAGYEWRDRNLGPVLTVQTLLMQILHPTAMTRVSRLTGNGVRDSHLFQCQSATAPAAAPGSSGPAGHSLAPFLRAPAPACLLSMRSAPRRFRLHQT